MSAILCSPVAPVKSATTRRFGEGILATHLTYRTDYSDADARWNAEMNAAIAARDAHYDRMASEAAAVDRLCSGYSC